MTHKHIFTPLDAEEATLMSEIERGERKSVPSNDPLYEQMRQAARNTLKTKPVNLRIPVRDVLALKEKAIREGVPYQSLIRKLIHQYLSDQKTFSSNA